MDKKRKKTWYRSTATGMIVLLITLLFCACGKSDSLVGTWVPVDDQDVSIVLYNDGNGIYTIYGTEHAAFNWYIEKKYIVFDDTDPHRAIVDSNGNNIFDTNYELELSGKTMTLYIPTWDGPSILYGVYEKID